MTAEALRMNRVKMKIDRPTQGQERAIPCLHCPISKNIAAFTNGATQTKCIIPMLMVGDGDDMPSRVTMATACP